MSKWKLYLLSLLCIILMGAGKASAFQIINASSFTVTANVNSVPVISTASAPATLTQLSGNTQIGYAVISATVACGALYTDNTATKFRKLTSIAINCNCFVLGQNNLSSAHNPGSNPLKTGQITPSTTLQIPCANSPYTYVVNPSSYTSGGGVVSSVYFSTAIPVDLTSRPASFSYNIVAVDNAIPPCQTCLPGPTTGQFSSFKITYSTASSPTQPIQQPPQPSTLQMFHYPFSAVCAFDEIFVASGTVSSKVGVGVSSITLCYSADGANFLSKQIILSSAPSVYNFRFETNVNLIKAKYLYYYLTATDTGGNVANVPSSGNYYTIPVISAKTVTCGPNGGIICLPNGDPDDGQTTIQIPPGAIDGNMDITITQIDPSDTLEVPNGKSLCASARPVSAFTFGPENLMFKKFVTMKLLFQDITHSGKVDGTAYKVNSLRLFWWDGFDWRLLGGKKDPDYNLINYGNIQHFSKYALFPANALTDNDYRPKERIITPATKDGINDFAQFSESNPGDIANIKIYDVTGREIRQLNNGVLAWDGKDNGGQLVESGIYIYQIKLGASSKIISGTIVVAK